MNGFEIYDLGDCALQCGGTLPAAKLAYVTHGTLNAARDNAIVFPTHYGGTHVDNAYLVGEGKALDPRRYFIIVPDLLCDGMSSSPSNTPAPCGGPAFPHVTVCDNVAFQHRLVSDVFGIERLQMVVGFSMGAQQTFQWAVAYPSMVERAVAICGSARTAIHNKVFLEGVMATLRADCAWQGGHYEKPPEVGLRALGRVWAGWGMSQAFYRQQLYLEAGYESLEDYVERAWEDSFLAHDANDLLALAWTWQHADVGATPGFEGNLEAALASITARTLIMPCATDLYFPVDDSAYEARHIPGAKLEPIPSLWGHTAGAGPNAADAEYVNDRVREWLSA